jgi:hypothetical protein
MIHKICVPFVQGNEAPSVVGGASFYANLMYIYPLGDIMRGSTCFL